MLPATLHFKVLLSLVAYKNVKIKINKLLIYLLFYIGANGH
jgi:hypothetical protein